MKKISQEPSLHNVKELLISKWQNKRYNYVTIQMIMIGPHLNTVIGQPSKSSLINQVNLVTSYFYQIHTQFNNSIIIVPIKDYIKSNNITNVNKVQNIPIYYNFRGLKSSYNNI